MLNFFLVSVSSDTHRKKLSMLSFDGQNYIYLQMQANTQKSAWPHDLASPHRLPLDVAIKRNCAVCHVTAKSHEGFSPRSVQS